MEKVIIFFVALAVMLTFCSCGEKEEYEIGREAGFYSGGGDPSSGYYCGYKIEQDEYDLDNVTLQFYYGSLHPNGYEERGLGGANIIIRLFFSQKLGPIADISDYPQLNLLNDPNFFYIKEIDDFFIETYHCSLDEKTHRINYNFSEYLKIPQECFIETEKYLYFNFIEYWLPLDREPYNGSGGGILIYYEIRGDKVILSSKPFELK